MQNENLLSGYYEKEWGERLIPFTSLPRYFSLTQLLSLTENTFLNNL